MAGYSGTPLAKKLGIDAGTRVALVAAPRGFVGALALPRTVKPAPTLAKGSTYDVIVFFTKEEALLRAEQKRLVAHLDVDGGLWIAWPKKAAKVATDMTEDVVRDVFLPQGLVDNKVCAIDETWSGLRVVWRKELRARRTAGDSLAQARASLTEPGPRGASASGRTSRARGLPRAR